MTDSASKEFESSLWKSKDTYIAILAIVGILIYLIFRFGFHTSEYIQRIPLLVTMVFGGIPLVYELLVKLVKRQFGSDLLAGISIVTSVFLDQYLAGCLVILMLSGGEALEEYAIHSASSVLNALAKRVPSIAHRKQGSEIKDISLNEIAVGDIIQIFPNEISPVDGEVIEGHGIMDESYLTGEPFMMSKTPGSEVLSGSINGQSALTIRANKLPVDSRYAKIMEVMRASEQQRPNIRRLGDQLGAFYTPVAVGIAAIAWIMSGSATRFLAVLVVATPCPLLIAIPVAIIGSISLSARRGIIIKNPVVLEQIDQCRTMIFDKTGTLTYGEPKLTEQICAPGFQQKELLMLTASMERYSKHPLARAILLASEKEGIAIQEANEINEHPGDGMRGMVENKSIWITSRKKYLEEIPDDGSNLPPAGEGLECFVIIDGKFAAVYRFRDEPRTEGVSFIKHLIPKHHVVRVMLVSGDRESEVRYLANHVGITEVYAQKSPEEKLAIVQEETKKGKTFYLGDGINDAPAMMAATVAVAAGQNSDIASEAAGAVIMDSSLKKVDEFFHISRRMRSIALQSAVGGMATSIVGMFLASAGYLTPVAGAICQEIIDVLAVINALRVAIPPKELSDF
jgi:heavy metal translocating P-type ATPase